MRIDEATQLAHPFHRQCRQGTLVANPFTEDVGGVSRDRPGRAVRENDHEKELIASSLEVDRCELLCGQRVRL